MDDPSSQNPVVADDHIGQNVLIMAAAVSGHYEKRKAAVVSGHYEEGKAGESMADKHTPETAVTEEQSGTSASFYGTSTPKKPKDEHIGFLVTVCLLVILFCTLGTLGSPAQPKQQKENLSTDGDDSGAEEVEPIRSLLVDDADCAAPVLQLTQTENAERSEEALKGLLSDSTVCVEVDFYERSIHCTGVIFTGNGYVLAGCGDLREACSVVCLLPDGTTQPAAYLGFDAQTGLGLLKLSRDDCRPCSFARPKSTGTEQVYTLDWPNGSGGASEMLSGTLQSGKTVRMEASCGAPLMRSDGCVIGILTDPGEQGSGTVVSGDALPKLLERILSGNPAAQLWLGFDVGGIPTLLTGYYDYPGTLWIRSVIDSRLQEAGLYTYDILLTVDGESISTWEDYNEALSRHSPGDEIRLTIYRDGEILPVDMVVRGR